MVAEDCKKSRVLLRTYCWSTCSNGYAQTRVNRSSTKSWHQIFFNYEDGLVADHINHKRFDNRMDNIRIVTPEENRRNLTITSRNTSGKLGVCRYTNKKRSALLDVSEQR